MTALPAHTVEFLLDSLLPGSEAHGMPALSELDFAAYLEHCRGSGILETLVGILEQEAPIRHGRSFVLLGDQEKLSLLERIRKQHLRVFNELVTPAFQYYYHHPRVLQALGAGSTPPFPDGNSLPDGDFSLLETVYERGRIFRPTGPESRDPNAS